MSEEVALSALDAAYQETARWHDAYELLLGAWDLRDAIDDCRAAMADLGGLVYDVAIAALADQATEARARADELALQLHDRNNQIQSERGMLMEAEDRARWADADASALRQTVDAMLAELDAARAVVEVATALGNRADADTWKQLYAAIDAYRVGK